MIAADVVFNIQRFSLHDGPGIRTTVFLKGCPMRCFWCHNPEGQRHQPELRYFSDRCLACGRCVEACPNHAHQLHDGVHVFLRDRCDLAGACVETCNARALQLEGRLMTVGQVMDEVLPDKPFYDASGGGVTLSGGEPALGRDFAREILKECRSMQLHTAVETCGEVPWSSLEALLAFTNLVMMDLKLISREKHQRATGQSNERILGNARQLAMTDKPLIFRTPVVPSVNDSEEEIGEIASFVGDLINLRKRAHKTNNEPADIRYELLAFHKLAADKYPSLGLDYAAASTIPPTKEKMGRLIEAAKRHGVQARSR